MYGRYVKNILGNAYTTSQAEYEEYSRYFAKNYLKFLPALKECSIVDLGCGLGHFLYFLKSHHYTNAIGVDIGSEQINHCESMGFTVVRNDVLAFLKESTGSFDVLIANDLLEHFSKTQVVSFLKLARSKLNSGGVILVKTINQSNVIMGASSRYLDFTHEVAFTEESLAQVLKMANFADVKIVGLDIYVRRGPVNLAAKLLASLLNLSHRFFFRLYGRKTTTIFGKFILGVAINE